MRTLKFVIVGVVLLSIFLTFGGSTNENKTTVEPEVETPIPPVEDNETYSTDVYDEPRQTDFSDEARVYYKEIALKSEFDENYKPKRWNEDIKIFVKGSKVGYLMDELKEICAELNNLMTGVNLVIVGEESQSNYIIYFGNQKVYNELYPSSIPYTEHNLGLFILKSDGNGFTSGSMYVDINRVKTVNGEKHLLREELTQSIGLPNDSYMYPESIFYKDWTETTKYTELDKQVIQMLYN